MGPNVILDTNLAMRPTKASDLDRVNAVLKQGPDVNGANAVGKTALHLAARNGNLAIVTALLEAGAYETSGDNRGWTPLHFAAYQGHGAVISALLEAGHSEDVNTETDDGQTALELAIERGHTNAIQILRTHLEPKSAELRKAAQEGDLGRVTAMLLSGADVNGRDSLGFTPLHYAAGNNRLAVVRFLIEKGADVNAQAYDIEGYRHRSVLHLPARLGYIDVVRELIKAGTDVNLRTNGVSALEMAMQQRRNGVINELLNAGADAESQARALEWAEFALRKRASTPSDEWVRTWEGRDPYDTWEALLTYRAGVLDELMLAIQSGDRRHVNAMIKDGADVNMQESGGWTPLHQAVETRHRGITEILLDAGADVNAQDSSGWTPLHWAVYAGYLSIAEVLIDGGADVDAQDDSGRTPLHVAVENHRSGIAEMLLDAGADVNAQEDDGWTPLHSAAYVGNLNIAEILIDGGADVNTQDDSGWTPLYVAQNYVESEHPNLDLVALLQTAAVSEDI